MLNAFESEEKQKKQAEIERKASACDSLTSEWKIKHRLVKLRRQRTKREGDIKKRGATMMQAIIRGFLARRAVRFLFVQRRDETMQMAATAEEEERLRKEKEEEERLRKEDEERLRKEEEERLRKEEEEEERLRKEKEERLRKEKEDEERLRKEKEERLRSKEEEEEVELVKEEKEDEVEKEEEVEVEYIEKEEEEEEEKDGTEDESSVESAAVSIQRIARGLIGRKVVEEKRNQRLEILRKNLEYLDKQPTQKIKKRKIGRPERPYGSAVHYPLPKN
eukprot:g3764.t1